MKNKLGQEPVFPLTIDNEDSYGRKWKEYNIGISKRFYAACAAMQGLISNSYVMQKIANSEKNDLVKDRILIEQAYDLADELLKQEND